MSKTNALVYYPEKIPEYKKQISIYRTIPFRTASFKNVKAKRYITNRMTRYSKLFDFTEKPEDIGDRFVYSRTGHDLEIFKTSDSLRYTNVELKYPLKLPDKVSLPTKDEAYEITNDALKKYELSVEHAKISSFTYTELAKETNTDGKMQIQKIEANVEFNFELDDLPVWGPGAKIKTSLVENSVAGILYFWRKPVYENVIPVIHPLSALERFTTDRSFKYLDKETAEINIHSASLGYYSLSPSAFQRFLIPVYAIKYTVNSKFMDPYHSTQFVVAVDISLDEIKEMGVVDNPYQCLIF